MTGESAQVEVPEKDVTGEPLLRLSGVSAHFGGVRALADVSFAVQSGQFTGIVGPNGAGKTTLLNAVNGLIRTACSGSIQLSGVEILRYSPARIAQLGICRSFQHPPILEGATVMENLLCGTHLRCGYGMVREIFNPRFVRRVEARLRDEAMEVLEIVGLADVADRPASELPYAARKLADVARALISRPTLLLLDEPTSGLGREDQGVVLKMLSQLRSRGDVTVLLIEHHMDLVRQVTDQVVGMQAGTALMTGTPSQVLDSEAFREAIVGVSASHKRTNGRGSMK